MEQNKSHSKIICFLYIIKKEILFHQKYNFKKKKKRNFLLTESTL